MISSTRKPARGQVVKRALDEVEELVPVIEAREPYGLTLEPDLDFEVWMAIGARLGEAHRRLPWMIGDWLIHGEDTYGERHSQAFEIDPETGRDKLTGLRAETLAVYASACRAWPRERRRAQISFSHHQALASVARRDPMTAERFLVQAESEGLDTKEIRAVAREWRAGETKIEPALSRLKSGARPDEILPPAPHCVTCTCYSRVGS